MKQLLVRIFACLMFVTLTFSCSKKVEEVTVSSSSDDIADTLNVNFAMGNNARTMTYQKANPLTLPDGTIVTQGDLKPTWQYIEKQMGFKISDNAVQDQKASEMIDIAAATGFSSDTIYGGNSIAEQLMKYGAQGYLVNLKENLDKMPNFKKYLENNPNVAKSITAFDGGIYQAPYVAEIGNYARAIIGRPDWVTSLLDSTDMLENETHTLEVKYSGYWDRYDANVVDLQNAAADGGVLTQAAALSVLKDYIASTYPDLAKPSDLYVGDTAVYDMDELIALWRVIELSPNTLSKVSTGKVVPNTEISPFFVRKSSYREDVLRLLSFYDGQKVHASDSYAARQYVDENGEMVYSYANDDFLEKVNYIKQIFEEGLIHSEFSDLSIKDEFRKSMFFADGIEGQRQFGFMTYDWFASTTGGSDKTFGFLPPVTTISKAGINEFIHYVENTRAIKPDGWSISAAASDAEKNAAFKLFDYFYTEAGNQVQNYSIPEILDLDDQFVGPDGTKYPKFGQWIIDNAAEFKNGDISGFLRDFMGSLLSVGFQKEIGFELQTTNEHGFMAWELYTKADVLTMSYETDNDYLRLMPPVISLNEQDTAKLGTVAVGEDQTDKIFIFITGDGSVVSSTDDLKQEFEEAGIASYESVYQTAYNRMMGK